MAAVAPPMHFGETLGFESSHADVVRRAMLDPGPHHGGSTSAWLVPTALEILVRWAHDDGVGAVREGLRGAPLAEWGPSVFGQLVTAWVSQQPLVIPVDPGQSVRPSRSTRLRPQTSRRVSLPSREGAAPAQHPVVRRRHARPERSHRPTAAERVVRTARPRPGRPADSPSRSGPGRRARRPRRDPAGDRGGHRGDLDRRCGDVRTGGGGPPRPAHAAAGPGPPRGGELAAHRHHAVRRVLAEHAAGRPRALRCHDRAARGLGPGVTPRAGQGGCPVRPRPSALPRLRVVARPSPRAGRVLGTAPPRTTGPPRGRLPHGTAEPVRRTDRPRTEGRGRAHGRADRHRPLLARRRRSPLPRSSSVADTSTSRAALPRGSRCSWPGG